MSAVNSTGSSSSSSSSQSTPTATGLSALTPEDFLNLLITQLQNQDPTQPMDNAQLLTQLSDMQSLQANINLQSTLQGLTLNQQLSEGASLIGLAVAGTDSKNNQITGVVDYVAVRNGASYVGVNTGSGTPTEIPVSSVTEIAPVSSS